MSNSIKQQLSWAKKTLANESAALDAEILLAHVLGKGRSYIYAWPDVVLHDDQLKHYALLIQERLNGKPVAYILGTQEFWSISLKVSPATLIPRPETEQLVDAVLQHFPANNIMHVLDAGTGTGAIALALSSEKPSWQVFACDYSLAALAVARQNALDNHLNVHYFCSDWLSAVKPEVLDIIVSNPPYIAEHDIHLSALSYEPESALVAGESGLSDIKTIVQQAKALLKPQGRLYIEHGYDQGLAVSQCFSDNQFMNIVTAKDYAGCDRFTYGVKA
jgi:release factor glutamine methyltransferase